VLPLTHSSPAFLSVEPQITKERVKAEILVSLSVGIHQRLKAEIRVSHSVVMDLTLIPLPTKMEAVQEIPKLLLIVMRPQIVG